jgi:ABC-type nitrate/sulfonate/bicarbonate transport system permease component
MNGKILTRLSQKLHLSTVFVLILLVGIWWQISRSYSIMVMPSPGAVWKALKDITVSGALWQHVAASLARISIGFSTSILVATLLCSLAVVHRVASDVVKDIITILQSTSVFVWIVLSLIWFGLSDMATIFTTFLICLPVLANNLFEGVQSVDARLIQMGTVFKLSRLEKFKSIIIPSCIPFLVAGMKVAFGLALKVSVVAEMFGVSSGIGYIMNYSRELLETDAVFAWAVVMVVIMMVIDKLIFESLARKVSAWQ